MLANILTGIAFTFVVLSIGVLAFNYLKKGKL